MKHGANGFDNCARNCAKYDPTAGDDQPRKLDTDRMPMITLDDMQRCVHEAIEAERAAAREHFEAIVPELIARIQRDAAEDLEYQKRLLIAEIVTLKTTLAELKMIVATEKSGPVDLPKLPLPQELAKKGRLKPVVCSAAALVGGAAGPF